ncbi:MAG TPA: FecR domain-containing protein [Steroidobacter sp.]|uniref:FecR family protein n=1 Tax=Steroidobacter sp. TaxID=1978227 RepID=UPI002ED9EAD3
MDSAKIELEAAEWLARRDGGHWSEADEAAFAAWQDQSTAHRVAVIRLQTVWQRADRLQALGAGVPRGEIPPPGQWRLSGLPERAAGSAAPASGSDRSSRMQPRPLVRAIAAIMLVMLGAVLGWYSLGRGAHSYSTAIGSMEVVPLADGSRITLNTASAMRVELSDTERRVRLDRGEAFFEVAKDPTRRFVVQAGNKQIVAVGTKFSVFNSDGTVRVVVTEGIVEVTATDSVTQAPTTPVTAGSIAQAGAAGVVVQQLSVADAESSLSWRSGYIALRDTPLADAVTEFNRYNEKQIVIADPELADLRVGGNVRTTNVIAFVHVLERGFPVRATELGDRIILQRR